MRESLCLGIKNMDRKKAFSVLGVDDSVSSHEVEERFRVLANDAHPDKGGSDQLMSELNDARATAIKFIDNGNALVPAKALQSALIAVQSQALAQQHLSNRILESRKDISARTTNKLRTKRVRLDSNRIS